MKSYSSKDAQAAPYVSLIQFPRWRIKTERTNVAYRNGLFSLVYLLTYELKLTNLGRWEQKKRSIKTFKEEALSFLSLVFLTFPYTLLRHQKSFLRCQIQAVSEALPFSSTRTLFHAGVSCKTVAKGMTAVLAPSSQAPRPLLSTYFVFLHLSL